MYGKVKHMPPLVSKIYQSTTLRLLSLIMKMSNVMERSKYPDDTSAFTFSAFSFKNQMLYIRDNLGEGKFPVEVLGKNKKLEF